MSFDEYKSTHKVKAEQVEEVRSVITPNGPVTANPGQWEVRFPDGNVQVVDDDQFTAAFKGGDEEEVMSEAEENKVSGPEVPPTEEDSEEEGAATTEEAKPTEPAQKTKAPTKPR